MMMPPDPLRQKMLFKTEWRSLGADGEDPRELAEQMNNGFGLLLAEGYQISQVVPSPTGRGMLILAQRITSPIADPTPQGVPLPGTGAMQEVEITYSFTECGAPQEKKYRTLKEAVEQASKDLSADNRQPLAIHVSSITTYRTGDIHLLAEKFLR